MRRDPEALLIQPDHIASGGRRIAYIPFEDVGNAYTERMRELMAGFGRVERFAGIKQLLRRWPRSRHSYEAIIVNWTENAILAAGSGRISPAGTAWLFFRTVLMKAFTRRLIFVRHNNYPHRTAAGSEYLARRLVDYYESLFDIVITHSGAAANAGRSYCPHPLYRPVQNRETAESSLGLPAEYFLAFGRIAPYKRLDALIASFPRQCTLVVAGAVGDTVYARRLADMRSENVLVLPGRIDEATAQRLVRSARGMVIANAEPDMVVSSSFFYAVSFGCPVFAVRTPFLAWARRRLGGELLHLGRDLGHLCRIISQAPARTVSQAACDAVAREFGDHAVVLALAETLGSRP